jgi:hypothetical protein
LGVTHYRIGWELSSYEDGTFFNVDEPLYKENGGYGMPVREKPYCKLEKEHKPCEKVEDLPNDSYKPKEIGA